MALLAHLHQETRLFTVNAGRKQVFASFPEQVHSSVGSFTLLTR